ncbi:hypothetical protein ACVRWQ_00450 [Streptococcus phocae subsp. salmonis]|uniref:hypothetical protein n=1 Tax=Streptococcus phocae TaxID=119224 RepID=UPI00053108FE|nr:hypothetical protein [Streptococcus phocae]KGR72994.1 hypothetical protein NX86_03385 [Streptococcus phocae subsp. salmonis]
MTILVKNQSSLFTFSDGATIYLNRQRTTTIAYHQVSEIELPNDEKVKLSCNAITYPYIWVEKNDSILILHNRWHSIYAVTSFFVIIVLLLSDTLTGPFSSYISWIACVLNFPNFFIPRYRFKKL